MINLTTILNSFGPTHKRLTWDTNTPSSSVDFLDLTITISTTGILTTKTYQKPQNTYLYWTPNSCQPPSYLKSFVYSSLHRYYWQNSQKSYYDTMIRLLHDCLLARGHTEDDLAPIFISSMEKVQHSSLPDPRIKLHKNTPTLPITASNENNLFLHYQYNPNNPSNQEIKALALNFQSELDKLGFKVDRIIKSYSRPPNIGDICKKHRLEESIDTTYKYLSPT